MASIKTRKFNDQGYVVYEKYAKNRRAKSDTKNGSRINNDLIKNSIGVYKIDGDYTPISFVSKLYKPKNVNAYRHFLDLETHKLSSLQPSLTLYKVQNSNYIPFYFPIAAERVTRESMLGPGTGIGASGIKSMSVQYTGNNPFSFDKQIDCNLSIFVDNLENIFKEVPPGFAKLADLFTISRRSSKSVSSGVSKEVSSEQTKDASSFEIAMRMGYSFPERSNIFTAAEKEAIRKTNVTIRMTLYDHSINVNQDGTATIDISYIGRLEGALHDSMYDVMREPSDLVILAGFKSGAKKDKKPDDISEEEKEEQQRASRARLVSKLRRIFTYLTDDKNPKSSKQRIHDISLSSLDMSAFRMFQDSDKLTAQTDAAAKMLENQVAKKEEKQFGRSLEQMKITAAIEANTQKALGQKLNLSSTTAGGSGGTAPSLGNFDLTGFGSQDTSTLVSQSQDLADETLRARQDINKDLKELDELYRYRQKNKSISYVYVGDVVESISFNIMRNLDFAITKARDQAMQGLDRKSHIEQLQKSLLSLKSMKILFSTVPINTPNGVKVINIADVPIELSILGKHFFDEIEQMSKNKFSVKSFLDDLCCKLIAKALSSNISEDVPTMSSNIAIRSLLVTGPKSDKLQGKKDVIDIDDLPDFHKAGTSTRSADDHDYYIVYSEATEDSPSGLSGDAKKDARDGIYHLQIGKNRGMLKNVSFSKYDIPGRKESLMLESVSLYDELKMPYTANIEMFGNNFFLPGMMIYLNPSSIGFGDPRSKNSAAFRLGLGGYYQVITVSTNFNGSAFSTSLSTSYVSWADSDSSFLAEIAQSKPKAPDQNPESKSTDDAPSYDAPNYESKKSSDYDVIRSSTLLTEDEKNDIIRAELTNGFAENNTSSRRVVNQGREYLVRRRSGVPNITVSVGENNSISIKTEASN